MSKKKITFKPTRDWIFAEWHWWQLLKGFGRYENIKRPYSNDFIKYSKLVLNTHSNRIDNVLKVLAVGPEAKWVKEGDTVMIDPSGKGHIIALDEVPHVMVPEFMVLGVM